MDKKFIDWLEEHEWAENVLYWLMRHETFTVIISSIIGSVLGILATIAISLAKGLL